MSAKPLHLTCIVCSVRLTNLGVHQPSHGLSFSSYGHYGSEQFDPVDGSESIYIAVCDDCLLTARKKGQVAIAGEPAKPKLRMKLWKALD